MDDDGNIPPPYALNDPLPLNPSGRQYEVRAHRRLSPREQDAPTYGHVAQSVSESNFSSAVDYFEETPPSQVYSGQDLARHSLTFNRSTKRNELDSVPVCWLVDTSDISDWDMKTFSNYLFPTTTSTTKPSQSRTAQKQASEPDAEPWATRKTRMASVIAEWNEGFFSPRGLYLDLIFDDSINNTPTTWCSACKAATRDVKEPLSPASGCLPNCTTPDCSAKPTAAAQIKRAAGLLAQHVVNQVEQSSRAQADRRHGCRSGNYCHGAFGHRGASAHHQRHHDYPFSQPSRCSKASKPSKPSPQPAALNPLAHLLQNLTLQHPAPMSREARADLRIELRGVRKEIRTAVSEVRAQKRAEGRERRSAGSCGRRRRGCGARDFGPLAPVGGSLLTGDKDARGPDAEGSGDLGGVQPLGWQRGERRELRAWRREGLREIRGAKRELRKEERFERRGRHGWGGRAGEGETDVDGFEA